MIFCQKPHVLLNIFKTFSSILDKNNRINISFKCSQFIIHFDQRSCRFFWTEEVRWGVRDGRTSEDDFFDLFWVGNGTRITCLKYHCICANSRVNPIEKKWS